MLLFITLFTLIIRYVLCANILYINPFDSKSHHIWNEVLIQGLLEKGHNITFLGHNKASIQSENYTAYKLDGIENLDINFDFHDFGDDINPIMDLINFWNYMYLFVEPHLKSDALKVILDYPRDKFDLIILDLVRGQEFYPLIDYFGNPPVVATSPFSLPPYILDVMGGHFYFYYPIYNRAYTDSVTFLQRVENTCMYIIDYFLKWRYLPSIYKKAQARYGQDIAPFDQVERKIGILLANYDPVLDFPQPLPSNIIPVGGMHVKRSEKLPKDLQEILDNANDGIIFFSFGTIMQPSWLPTKKKEIFMKVFSKLNQTVLWKYTADDLKDVPKNVIIRKWFSQNDILAHKNVKLFITHSGGLSSAETMYHGVPIVSIPFFVDQKVMAGKMVARKLGKKLHINDLTEDGFYETILEVINNPIYKENVEKISRKFRDQKENPLERATFWVEYALRNKDLSHLSGRARNMTLFQRENLDVFGFILFIVILLSISLFVIVKYIVNYLIFKKKEMKGKVKQN